MACATWLRWLGAIGKIRKNGFMICKIKNVVYSICAVDKREFSISHKAKETKNDEC